VPFAVRFGAALTSAAVGITVARHLEPESRGELATLFAVLDLSLSVYLLGLHKHAFYLFARHSSAAVTREVQLLGLAHAVGAPLFLMAVFGGMGTSGSTGLLLILIGMFRVYAAWFDGFARGRLRFGVAAAQIYIERGTTFLALLVLPASLDGAVAAYLAGAAAGGVYMLSQWRARPARPRRLTFAFFKRSLRKHGFFQFGNLVLSAGLVNFFVLICGAAGATALAGRYAVIGTLWAVVTIATQTITTIMIPQQMHARRNPDAAGSGSRALYVAALAGFALLFFAAGPAVIAAVFGQAYVPSRAVLLVALLFLAQNSTKLFLEVPYAVSRLHRSLFLLNVGHFAVMATSFAAGWALSEDLLTALGTASACSAAYLLFCGIAETRLMKGEWIPRPGLTLPSP
jgi:O-antigen/teichoic acid export membrane protein